MNVIAGAVVVGILTGIMSDILSQPYVQEVRAETVKEEPREVLLEVVYNWTPERIEQEIRTVFHEQPDLAVAVFRCESGLKPHAKGPTSDFGIAQIHKPSWHQKAIKLGYEDYQTDVIDNLAMARYIYDGAGGTFKDWVCYTKRLYK